MATVTYKQIKLHDPTSETHTTASKSNKAAVNLIKGKQIKEQLTMQRN